METPYGIVWKQVRALQVKKSGWCRIGADSFNDRLRAEGHWVFAGGLASPSTATVIDNRSDEPVLTDGPYLESKEYLAGLWIVMSMLLPPEYEVQLAKQRMAELALTNQRSIRSRRRVRRKLASGLRKLADWIEPALSIQIPTQRRTA